MYVIDIEKRDSRYSDTKHFKMLCTTEAKKNEFVKKIKAEMLPQVGTFYKETDAGFRYMDESFGMGKILFVDAHEDATAITEFRGEHAYLSNFYETPIAFDARQTTKHEEKKYGHTSFNGICRPFLVHRKEPLCYSKERKHTDVSEISGYR